MRGLFKTLTFVVLFCILTVTISGGLFLWNILKDLPDVAKLKEFHHSHATEVFSAEGKKIGEFTTERRYQVRFEAIPQHVILAFIAAEDASFFKHKGIDYAGVMRAVLSNVMRGRYAQGGSTITQQVARALLLGSKKKEITRKIREMVLAWRMEKELTKNEILSLYLSEIYLGHGAYGIGAAAQNYFGKKVADLDVAEASLLAGLPQRPNDWNPFHNPHMAKSRQQYVLKRMMEETFIDLKQSVEAYAKPLRLYELEDVNLKAAPFYTEYVRMYLMNKYGADAILTQGLKVYTPLRYDLQKHAEKTLIKGLREVDKRLGWRGVPLHVGPEKIPDMRKTIHEEVIAALTPVRILPASFDDKAEKRLEYDLTPFHEKESSYFGITPVQMGEYHRAIITEVTDARIQPGKGPVPGQALGIIGNTPVTISQTTMEWVLVDEKPVQKVSQILKVGDVVPVRVDAIDRASSQVTASLEQEPEVQGAVLSFDLESGDVQTMVGGTDFQKSKFNCALQAKRQVGSTFKPILYAAAIDRGFSPSSLVTDSPIVFKFEGGLDADNTGEAWRPHNYSGTFEGDIPLRLALIRSMNIPTVKLLNEITIDYGIQYARRMGITAPLQRDLSIGLGSWSSSLEEVMRAYSVFPRLGKPARLNYIKKVVDGEGKVIEENPIIKAEEAVKDPIAAGVSGTEPVPEETISPQTAYVMTDMLKGAVREGTGRPAFLPVPMAGKTGTSNDHRDAWFIGYTPFVISGIWIGYEKDKPLSPGETGGKAAAPIWAQYMEEVVKQYPKNDFPIPDDVVFAYVDRQTGRLATSTSASRVRVAFRTGTVPSSTIDNLPRIGEPGAGRATSTEGPPLPPLEDEPAKENDVETSDYLRQSYQ